MNLSPRNNSSSPSQKFRIASQTDIRSMPRLNKKSVVFHPFDQKSTFICKFCGGRGCKHENWLTHPESAIRGLNSDWVTNNILATQRPSSRLIKEFDIVKQFKDKGINAIFNLQEPGEHPLCGDGIHYTSGFSYYPEEFSDHGIYFFNFGWKDMTAASTDVILRIVKQMSFSLTNGSKVAVHCHAGRGRTGLIIAAWLIFHNNMSAKEAIKHIRAKRKDAISKSSQEKILYLFEKEVKESRIIFFSSPKYGLEEYLYHQKKLFALSLGSAERYVPRLVLIVLERLETLIESGVCKPEDVLASFYSPNEKDRFKEPWGSNHEKFLKQLKERINTNNFEMSDIEDPRYLAQILLDFFDGFSIPAIEQRFVDAIHLRIHEATKKLTQEIKDQFFKELNKKEFFLVECFARFFAAILAREEDEDFGEQIVKAVLRVCISLLNRKKKLDKLFLKRNMIQEHKQDDQIMHLKIFLLKWVENFNENFTETFMLAKSPLNFNEKKVKEKLIKKGFRVDSYLSRILDAGSQAEMDHDDNQNQAPPSISNLEDEGTMKRISISQTESPNRKIALQKRFEEQKEYEKFLTRGSIDQKTAQDTRLKLLHLPDLQSPSSRSSDMFESSTAVTSRNKSTRSKTIMLANQMNGSLTSRETETPRKDYSSPNTERRLRPSKTILVRLSGDQRTQENVSPIVKRNIERHYSDFFGQIGGAGMDNTDHGEEQSLQSESDSVQDIMEQIKRLGAEKQNRVFRKLLEIQVSRNIPSGVPS